MKLTIIKYSDIAGLYFFFLRGNRILCIEDIAIFMSFLHVSHYRSLADSGESEQMC